MRPMLRSTRDARCGTHGATRVMAQSLSSAHALRDRCIIREQCRVWQLVHGAERRGGRAAAARLPGARVAQSRVRFLTIPPRASPASNAAANRASSPARVECCVFAQFAQRCCIRALHAPESIQHVVRCVLLHGACPYEAVVCCMLHFIAGGDCWQLVPEADRRGVGGAQTGRTRAAEALAQARHSA